MRLAKRAPALIAALLGLAMALPTVSHAQRQRLTDEGFQQAVQQLSSDDPEAREAAINLLARGARRRRRELTPHLRRLLSRDPDWRVRAAAARAIGRFTLRAAVPELVAALGDERPEVRVVSAAALWRLPDPSAVEPLIGMLDDADEAARQWAVMALGTAQDDRATTPLVARLADSSAAVRLDAIRALGRIGDPAALDGLRGHAADASHIEEERLECVNSIVQLRGPDKVNALVALLRVEEEAMLVAVVHGLGLVGDALVVPRLRDVSRRSRSSAVRTEVNSAIEAIEQRAAEAASGGGASPGGVLD